MPRIWWAGLDAGETTCLVVGVAGRVPGEIGHGPVQAWRSEQYRVKAVQI